MRAKPVSQQRSQQTRDQILAAMERLLKKQSFSEISVAKLAREARVSPASLYQRFSNIDATASVLLELYFRKVEEWTRRPGRRLAQRDAPMLDALRAIAADALDQLDVIGHIMRPAYLYSRQHPDRVGKEWAHLQEVALQGFRAFLRERSSEARVKDVDEAAEVLCQLFNFQILAPLLHGDETSWSSGAYRKRFADRLANLAYRYVAFPL